MADGTVIGLHLHPVKGCHRVEVASAVVGPHGLVGDREWQVSGTDGEPFTQRRHPVLATVRPEPTDGGLVLRAPGRDDLHVARGGPCATVRTMTGEEVVLDDAGDEAAAWFADLLGAEARLGSIGADYERRLPAVADLFGTRPALGDAAPVHLVNQASLADLIDRADEPFGMERFRPNVVVDVGEPWTEDTWRRVTVGEATLRTGFPWPRCTVPQVDQDTGSRTREPAVALRAHRWCHDAAEMGPLRGALEGNALFGLGCGVEPIGVSISVGDPVVVTEIGAALIPPPAPERAA